ncbi:nitroreductase family protein [Halomonas sp. ML-15]|uniref:nitroreductase family protein n=1 Tax=Halomonas sp. ML-15 TaxID=2773305 RepID=UPI00174705AB|nr:nitroreductase family protein [Halomonas sp. ML-15]MBD3897256.1 nitroreductase family protein [Halomonas sp. ML-15]
MSLIDALNWRYATKRMNGKQVPQAQLDRILEAVRLAPSSYGLQPYSVLVIEDPALRERISPAAFDQPQITQSSHLLVFAAWDSVEEAHVDDLIRLTAKTRGQHPDELAAYGNAIKDTVSGFASDQDKFHWAAKQAYLALGTALAAAATERVDASPMEGFDPAALDDLLGLRKQNLRSVVLMALGYRDSSADRHAGLEKVRWPHEKLFIPMPSA